MRCNVKGETMIYFDNAATSYPKPDCVIAAVEASFLKYGGNPGRSSHALSCDSALELYRARKVCADFFGATAENVIFTYNATYALNIAIKSSYIYGSHILISDLEHNSVLRPVATLTGNCFSNYSYFDSVPALSGTEREHAIISSIRTKMKPFTKTLVCTARSNVNALGMPIRAIGKFCREHDIYFIVDGSQSAGFDKIDVENDYIDALCLPGHKSLYGPMGTGLIVFSHHGASSERISSFIEGGNGYNSLDIRMPDEFPEKLEGGTLAVNVISGLKAGIEYVNKLGLEKIRAIESTLCESAYARLLFEPNIKIHGYVKGSSILLFTVNGQSSEKTASELDKYGICTRAGYHCAPLAHKRLGTPVGGGVRLSFGINNTQNELDYFFECVNKLVNSK